jgi:hypothetical protein
MAFLKVVEGSWIYNFPIHCLVHFYTNVWRNLNLNRAGLHKIGRSRRACPRLGFRPTGACSPGWYTPSPGLPRPKVPRTAGMPRNPRRRTPPARRGTALPAAVPAVARPARAALLQALLARSLLNGHCSSRGTQDLPRHRPRRPPAPRSRRGELRSPAKHAPVDHSFTSPSIARSSPSHLYPCHGRARAVVGRPTAGADRRR